MTLFLLLFACGSTPEAEPEPEPTEAAEIMADEESDGLLPPVFTAEEIMMGNPPGTITTFRMTRDGVTEVRQAAIVSADGGGMSLTNATLQPDGSWADKRVVKQSWKQMSDITRHPEDATKVSEETLETRAGTFETIRHDITHELEEGTMVNTLWYTESMAGVAVQMITTQDGEETYRMQVAARTVPEGEPE